tara:strand:+ start:609 stop:1109 length:501 start_codon:yes stop_codon:yes gene_type:complete
MNRKQNAFAIALTGLALGVSGQTALAQSASVVSQGNTSFSAGETVVAQTQTYIDVMAQLEASGYEVINVSRTWLGRVKIEARNQIHMREVVVSSSTGEVMSDVVVSVFAQNDNNQPAATDEETSGNEGLGVGVDINLGASGTASGGSNGGSAGGSASGGVSISIGN